jgi:hypothetical protein
VEGHGVRVVYSVVHISYAGASSPRDMCGHLKQTEGPDP